MRALAPLGWTAVVLLSLLAASGCAQQEPSTERHPQAMDPLATAGRMPAEAEAAEEDATASAEPEPLWVDLRPRATLIFDRQPGRFTSEDFGRSDWPSAPGWSSYGQVVTFREHFRDVQGPGFHRMDNTWRRFDTWRVGAAARP